MKCPQCNAELAEIEAFCHVCGQTLTGDYCLSCGERIAPGVAFCGKCGAKNEHLNEPKSTEAEMELVASSAADAKGGSSEQKSAKQKSAKQKREHRKIPIIKLVPWALSLALSLALAITILLFGGAKDAEVSFKTQEKAVRYFTNQIKAGDVEAAVRAFSVQARKEHYDFGKNFDALRAWNINSPLPGNYDIYKETNKASFKADAYNQIEHFILGMTPYVQDKNELPFVVYGISSEELIAALDPQNAQSLEFVRMDYANPVVQDSESAQKKYKMICEVNGFASYEEYAVLYKTKGGYYMGAVALVETGGEWQIFSLNSGIVKMSAASLSSPITKEEYMSAVSEWESMS
ncbi:MAG: zinc ribbon domain-containing protein [Oscillospiraceae bacterium]